MSKKNNFCVVCGKEAEKQMKAGGASVPVCSGDHWDKYLRQNSVENDGSSSSLGMEVVGSIRDFVGNADMVFAAFLVAALILSEKYLLAAAVFVAAPPYSMFWKWVWEKYR